MSAAAALATALAAAAAGVLVAPRGAVATGRVSGLSRAPAPPPPVGRRSGPGRRRAGRRADPPDGGGAPALPGGGSGRVRAGGGEGSSVAPRLRVVAALGAGVAVAVLVGGAPGAVVGLMAAALTAAGVGRLDTSGARDAERQVLAGLPLALDLLAACSASGVPLVDAIDAVATAVGGPLGAAWGRSCAAYRLGGDPAVLWGDEPLLPLRRPGRVLAAALTSGSRAAADLERLATDERESARRRGEAAARRAGVAAVLPLGLCFLPAFVLVGVVPVVVGLAGGILR